MAPRRRETEGETRKQEPRAEPGFHGSYDQEDSVTQMKAIKQALDAYRATGTETTRA